MKQSYIITNDNIHLYCPEPWNSRGWEEIKAIANGCGPSGWKEKIVPDSIFGCSIKEACELHDVEYEEGKDIEAKNSADRSFRNNMQRLVRGRTTNWFAKRLLLKPRLKLKGVYYQAVCKLGGTAFWDKHLKK